MSKVTFDRHYTHCVKRFAFCEACNKIFSTDEKEKHDVIYHTTVACDLCHQQIEGSFFYFYVYFCWHSFYIKACIHDNKIEQTQKTKKQKKQKNKGGRNALLEHQNNVCSHRNVNCKYCQLVFKANELNDHETVSWEIDYVFFFVCV